MLPDILSNGSVHPTVVAPNPSVKASAYSGPRSGRLIWTGVLGKRGVVEIDAGHPSVGAMSGSLPAVPLVLRVLPAEFDRGGLVVFTPDRAKADTVEPPGKANGWNATHFKFDNSRARDLVVLESPNRSNNFERLVLRNQGRDCTVIVVDWSVQ